VNCSFCGEPKDPLFCATPPIAVPVGPLAEVREYAEHDPVEIVRRHDGRLIVATSTQGIQDFTQVDLLDLLAALSRDKVAVCTACIDRLQKEAYPSKSLLDTIFPDLDQEDSELPTNPQTLDDETWALMFPSYPDDAPCLDCGQRWDEHESWPGDDGCRFTLNNEANRLARIRQQTRDLLASGMTAEELLAAVAETIAVVRGGAWQP
jgi:hypothetical protein